MKAYDPWPIGRLPKELQRVELEQVKALGYEYDDPRELVEIFENKIAQITGAPYAVAVDSCSNGLFLALRITRKVNLFDRVHCPRQTYISVPQQIKHAGHTIEYKDIKWEGMYELYPTNVIDAATRFRKDMYVAGSMMVLSFQIKKRVPIGRGGMIPLDNEKDVETLRKLRHDGRDLSLPYDQDPFSYFGYHMYMIPEDAARGLIILDYLEKQNPEFDFADTATYENYPPIPYLGHDEIAKIPGFGSMILEDDNS